MGYTHYWKITKPASLDRRLKMQQAAKFIFDNYGDGLAGWDGEPGEPIINSLDKIVFNGAAPDDFETFSLNYNDVDQFAFCKTGRRPYDTAVVAMLCSAADILNEGQTKGFEWSSDGEPHELEDGLLISIKAIQSATAHGQE